MYAMFAESRVWIGNKEIRYRPHKASLGKQVLPRENSVRVNPIERRLSLPLEFYDGLLPRRWFFPLILLIRAFLGIGSKYDFSGFALTHFLRRITIAHIKLESDIYRLAETWKYETTDTWRKIHLQLKKIFSLFSFTIGICAAHCSYIYPKPVLT